MNSAYTNNNVIIQGLKKTWHFDCCTLQEVQAKRTFMRYLENCNFDLIISQWEFIEDKSASQQREILYSLQLHFTLSFSS